ncbi:phosphoglycerate kinase [Glycomyces sp. TRM65418]|uniref:phosphoglycerate kinase n=1 Tax=Glycomyces sp. TRM65418 TaxID=2867006 RepID=UPI001CE55FBA|nr:phosphoglycerate kinase [Glycomyces sp. TRM65418]MCC3764319.1 phosphoglycerate kinase [Glycomyces sp. TRM65418]QZD53999.1 phosphoglycerate kinase [Glycomyces sp. TRM65418]
MKTLDELLKEGVNGRRVLVRADLNVPLDGKNITDDGRIRAVAPTVKALAEAGARVVVCSHLGRPKGEPDPAFSLAPVAQRLGEVLGREVAFAADTVGTDAETKAVAQTDGDVLLLENLRFNKGETSKDDTQRAEFAGQLAAFGDVYVDDAFGAVHRKHASVYDVAKLLPHYAGWLIAKEVEVLSKLTGSPEHPYVVVLGGAKVSDKLAVIDNLLDKVDTLIVGGGMMFTFLAAQGYEVGSSLLEKDQIAVCKTYLERAKELGVELLLPVDTVTAAEFAADAEPLTVAVDAIPAERMGLDIGPESATLFADRIAAAKTVFWNGPMGVFEFPDYAAGTKTVAQALVDSEAFSVVGGGDSAAAVRTLGLPEDGFGHISTGGGASLEYLEGKTLPGLDALEQ